MCALHITRDVEERHVDYLSDESRLAGAADGIAFPTSSEELAELLSSTDEQITVQGALTGITGGAVPDSGVIVNLSRMNRICGLNETGIADAPYSLVVEPGVRLADLRSALAKLEFDTHGWSDASLSALTHMKSDDRTFFFPPDPTEDTASIGGMIACNASGARSYKYGATRNYVRALQVMTVAGSSFRLERGKDQTTGRSFSIDQCSTRISGSIPVYDMPEVKNASGYYSKDDMDLVDLFIGAEGTLGIVTELELLLVTEPKETWGIIVFFSNDDLAEDYVGKCRSLECDELSAIEYFDECAIDLLRTQKGSNPAFSFLPDLKEEWRSCVFIELGADDSEIIEEAAMTIAELIEEYDVSESATWVATTPQEVERMKKFRHALPEAVNMTVDVYRKKEPELTKLGTDFAVPRDQLHRMMTTYKADLRAAEMDYVIFGHIGDDHLHVNILPRNLEEYRRGKELYLKWARTVIDMGGTVSAEHGIGKLKIAFLAAMYGDAGIKSMQQCKSAFDPDGRLNSGNLFEVVK